MMSSAQRTESEADLGGDQALDRPQIEVLVVPRGEQPEQPGAIVGQPLGPVDP